MLPKLANVRVVDSSGAGWIQTFHIYRGFWHRFATLGDYVKGSIKHVAFYPRYRRGKRYKPLRLGYKVRGIILQTRHPGRFFDGSRVFFLQNATALLKKRGHLKTKYNPTLLTRVIRKRHYAAVFEGYL